jgi:hypothetical protein
MCIIQRILLLNVVVAIFTIKFAHADTNLYINYYTDINGNTQRQHELDTCLNNNINNGHIDNVFVVVDNLERYKYLKVNPKLHLILNREQPTFSDMFYKIWEYSEDTDVSITCNSDIYFDKTIELAINYLQVHQNVSFALSRWDVNVDGKLSQITNPESQDAWIVYGKPKGGMNLDFQYGKWACDNRMAYELDKVGYTVLNPSHSIIIHHLHNSNIRKSTYMTDVVPPPHKSIPLSYL